MRSVFHSQLNLGEEDIAKIKLDPKSRDDIPQLLAGLQYIYTHSDVRQAVFKILEEVVPARAGSDKTGKASTDKGRPGMEQWRILVLGTLRLGLNADYDRIHELANQHGTVRQMLGHGFADYKDQYHLQTIKDNLSLFTPELLDRINQEVIRAGHILLKKNDANLSGRCDSFVVETDVHFPTDINLLFDAIRKTIEESVQLSETHDLTGWRQGQHNIKTFKKQYRIIEKQKHSTSKDETKKLAYEEVVKKSHESYINQAETFLKRAAVTRQAVLTQSTELVVSVKELDGYIAHAERHRHSALRESILDLSAAHRMDQQR